MELGEFLEYAYKYCLVTHRYASNRVGLKIFLGLRKKTQEIAVDQTGDARYSPKATALRITRRQLKMICELDDAELRELYGGNEFERAVTLFIQNENHAEWISGNELLRFVDEEIEHLRRERLPAEPEFKSAGALFLVKDTAARGVFWFAVCQDPKFLQVFRKAAKTCKHHSDYKMPSFPPSARLKWAMCDKSDNTKRLELVKQGSGSPRRAREQDAGVMVDGKLAQDKHGLGMAEYQTLVADGRDADVALLKVFAILCACGVRRMPVASARVCFEEFSQRTAFLATLRSIGRLGFCEMMREKDGSFVILDRRYLTPLAGEVVPQRHDVASDDAAPPDNLARSFFLWVVEHPSRLDRSTFECVLSYAVRAIYYYHDEQSMTRILVARLIHLGFDERDLLALTDTRRRSGKLQEFIRNVQEIYAASADRRSLLKSVSEHLLIGSQFEVGPWTLAWPAFEDLFCDAASPITVPDAIELLEISRPRNDRRIIGKSITRLLRERDTTPDERKRGDQLLALLRQEREKERMRRR